MWGMIQAAKRGMTAIHQRKVLEVDPDDPRTLAKKKQTRTPKGMPFGGFLLYIKPTKKHSFGGLGRG